MAKSIFLLPRKEMADKLYEVIEKYEINNIDVKVIKTSNAVSEAEDAVKNGADIIIARGIQANHIKHGTNYTVIEITITGQELGLLVMKGKKLLKKKTPSLAIVGIKNMFSDTSHFNELYDVDLRTYYVHSIEEIYENVELAVREGAEIIVGGDSANKRAEELGIPHLFADPFSEESILNVINMANKVGRAIDLEKKHSAQLQTLLDYSFNGIIKISKEGFVEELNSIIEDMLYIEAADAKGKHISELLKNFSSDILKNVLAGGKEYFDSNMKIQNKAFAVSLAPIVMEKDFIDGGIISFHEIENVVELETRIRSEIYQNDHGLLYKFEDLQIRSPFIKNELEKGRLYAQSMAPILIIGAAGSERDIIPQCIYNVNEKKSGPYIFINCKAYSPENQFEYLFENNSGEKPVIEIIQDGTLVLEDIEYLSEECQVYLTQILKYNTYRKKSTGKIIPLKFRIIGITESIQALKMRNFHMELFYILNTLSLKIPSLRIRKEDIGFWRDFFIKDYGKKYSRFISLTNDAKDILCDFYWKGELIQLKAFCEKIVITSMRRKVNGKFIEDLLVETFPVYLESGTENDSIEFENIEAAQIAALLKEFKGSRSMVASELGISTTTLWRKIKKYNI